MKKFKHEKVEADGYIIKFSIGDLVELKNGCRVLVSRLTSDFDGTPLYLLTFGHGSSCGFDDTDMKLIKRAND